MNRLTVHLKRKTYPVFFEDTNLPEIIPHLKERMAEERVFIITSPIVDGFHGPVFEKTLNKAKIKTHTITVKDGEQYKNLETVKTVYTKLLAAEATRESLILALGGGVIGDLAGFVAATYMRGISWIMVPTTLLSMVDSSVGGKVAVDHPECKNLIGTFHDPDMVFTYTPFLKTLPERDMVSGLAEVIKYGLILDPNFFMWIEKNWRSLLTFDLTLLEYAAFQSCTLKKSVIEKDESDRDIRRILNFGHTFAHAIESIGRYEIIRHGEAVLIGMLMAVRLSELSGRLSATAVQRIHNVLHPVMELIQKNLKPFLESLNPSDILTVMRKDKKRSLAGSTLILLNRIGSAETATGIPDDDIRLAVRDTLSAFKRIK